MSNQGCIYLLNNDSYDFLMIVNKYYAEWKNLAISADIPIISEVHKEISDIVKEFKGFYKPSGAGGNDIGIAFTNDIKVKRNLIRK